jgi:hypothetical protein
VGSSDGISINIILTVYMTGVDEYGWVCDVELAKRIILAHFSTTKYYGASVYGDKSMDEWLDKVSNDLQEFSDGFSIARDGGFFLGGLNRINMLKYCTLDAWIEESGDISCEEANEDILSVVEVDGKPVVFLLHESD